MLNNSSNGDKLLPFDVTEELVTWKEAFAAATRIMGGTAAILDAVLKYHGDKAMLDTARAKASDAATIWYYLLKHDPRCKDTRTGGERLADALKAKRAELLAEGLNTDKNDGEAAR